MAVQAGSVHTAVVLQGGGALGAYEYGVLRALHEQRPGFKPMVVAGISLGAITAAVLGGARDPLAALDRLWRQRLTVAPLPPFVWIPPPINQALAVLGNPGMYRFPPPPLPACPPPSPRSCRRPGRSPASTRPGRCGRRSANWWTRTSSTTRRPA